MDLATPQTRAEGPTHCWKRPQNRHPYRFRTSFPQQNPRLRRLYFEDMSTSTISVDEFQALEQKVLRAVEIVKREREARAAAEAQVASLNEQLESQLSAQIAVESQLNTLTKERDAVRQRVEKMLQQMDELL
jgi:septal ring factor EnvC (AmiA/AmiB activator)